MTNTANRINADQKAVLNFSHFIQIFERARAQTIEAIGELVTTLEGASASESELNFAGLVKASQQLLQLDDTELARVLNVARPTVGRWTRGVSAPHPLARKAVFDALVRTARAKLKLLRD